jgi:hypothetical protein
VARLISAHSLSSMKAAQAFVFVCGGPRR